MVGGEFYGPRKVAGAPIRLTPSPHTSDPGAEVVERVWTELEERAGLTGPV